MSAVIVKGIIISLSVVAAVGIALQQPEVQEWLEEQRRRIVELLKTFSDGLDPATRQQAEAFAFNGQMPTANREAAGVNDAIALATGRETDATTTSRRLNRQSSGPIDAEERRRLGREYLAKRNQELLDMQKKRSSDATVVDSKQSSAAPTDVTADELVAGMAAMIEEKHSSVGNLSSLINDDGSLKLKEKQATAVAQEVPAYEEKEPVPAPAPILTPAFETGLQYGNPFADEFSMTESSMIDRSTTPRPPVPPKLPHTPENRPITLSAPVEVLSDSTQNLSYDEQLARALSISADEDYKRRSLQRSLTEEEAFARAIAESLKDAERPTQATEAQASSSSGPLVDFSSEASQVEPVMPGAFSSNNPWQNKSDDDELYWLTPKHTGAGRNSRQISSSQDETIPPVPSISEAATTAAAARPVSPSPTPMSRTLSPEQAAPPSSTTLSPQPVPRDGISTGFVSDSDTEDFASLPASSAQSVGSVVEVEDVDIDSMSDDDGIATPSSWSEVGSEVGESERSESESEELVRL